ncbi:MAG: hydrolase [Defluviitaleaceae bacterium]|nr:hydrolase [Defluviitaleaceae bacterium]
MSIEKDVSASILNERAIPEYHGTLRSHMVEVPNIISKCGGIRIFGRLIKSLVFSTDIAIIRNINADAVVAVYPFTPQPAVSQALIMGSDLPVLCGVGGGTTTGNRVVHLASNAEFQGAFGVVLNAPTSNETIERVHKIIDIPIVITVVSELDNIAERIEAGAAILNVSGAAKTAWIVEKIRKQFPKVAIIATGGPNDQSINDTINAGADAITWTPPTTAEIFKNLMTKYRRQP